MVFTVVSASVFLDGVVRQVDKGVGDVVEAVGLGAEACVGFFISISA